MATTIRVVRTYRFSNARQLDRHFAVHAAEFGVETARAYEDLAIAFWIAAKPGVHECVRQSGERIRFDPSTDEMSVLGADNVILTFYRPVPCNSIPLTDRELAIRTGKCHGEANNLLYFQKECRR